MGGTVERPTKGHEDRADEQGRRTQGVTEKREERSGHPAAGG